MKKRSAIKEGPHNRHPNGKMDSPYEVAKVVSFLALDESSYVTGIELFVDGSMAQI
jgi:NAD(P)-dependent dehydrogenase (short-subunit alcohol dehydrogenase family)